ncbi:ribonuclease Z [Rhodocytophaga rosea]|uniref:Ribonuclease Z n=1 Tax=Rhodocytophaga rosea TaxID=2704465 RepID=A0A6C0GP05_9BACT|nr:ribonuclease Z [Rhodocytophaga rosea]QHT69765.1 ribonuclease Z [Rhodocytophaga rosea]
MTFVLKILGSNSAAPAFNRNPTSQLLHVEQNYFLIDCGEGTQMQLNKYKVRFNRIDHIFISHLHGDHYLGLTGLLSTMHLNKRTEDLYLFGPPGIGEILTLQFKYSDTRLHYKIHFRELTQIRELIFENENLTVETIPLNHRIQCTGFLFREKPKKRRLNKAVLPQNLSLSQIARLKKGEDLVNGQGEIIYRNEELTLPPKKSRSYAYCSDTSYYEPIIEQITGVDLLYHESTFLEVETQRASETFHSTARQAAKIAQLAKVKKLILGHYSSRYKDLSLFLEEARSIFPNTVLSIEGEETELKDIIIEHTFPISKKPV